MLVGAIWDTYDTVIAGTPTQINSGAAHFITLDKKGNIKMYTQVSKQVVEFGRPEEIEEKFKKLKIFYKEILPAKGWNSYDKVSVKFKDQIVCE